LRRVKSHKNRKNQSQHIYLYVVWRPWGKSVWRSSLGVNYSCLTLVLGTHWLTEAHSAAPSDRQQLIAKSRGPFSRSWNGQEHAHAWRAAKLWVERSVMSTSGRNSGVALEWLSHWQRTRFYSRRNHSMQLPLPQVSTERNLEFPNRSSFNYIKECHLKM